MIVSKLSVMRAEKEVAEGRKLTYETISKDTGLSKGVLVRLMNSDFKSVENGTLDTLCAYFNCGIGDLLEYRKG